MSVVFSHGENINSEPIETLGLSTYSCLGPIIVLTKEDVLAAAETFCVWYKRLSSLIHLLSF